MEDEGRSFLVGVYPTKAKAEEAKKKADGYYTHDIYKKIPRRTTKRYKT